MTDYSKMSDKEINIAVSIALGAKEVVPDLYMTDDRRFDFDLPKRGKPSVFFFDPCNSWADAGPIIYSNRIGIREYDGWWEGRSYIPEHAICDKSPLRAAMIVFLMMKEPQNDS
jgi:hypothetical protein